MQIVDGASGSKCGRLTYSRTQGGDTESRRALGEDSDEGLMDYLYPKKSTKVCRK
jgi:hypothetical protein